MHLPVVRRAELRARDSPVAGIVVVAVVALVSHARCIPLFARTAVMRHWYHSNRVVISLCIAAIAISHRGLAVVVTEDRAGNRHE